ncbi:MAG: DUF1667 domain-containing protein [Lachnospiraceae bacterium]|nr:DUF1667 domain-containing protein [Lachnospiraceae bacterium]
MTELICIVCPNGCHLNVDEENGYAVTGNKCPRGVDYGKKELTAPTRTITSTVRINGKTARRVPCKTSADFPKGKIFEVMAELDKVDAVAPIKVGDVIIENVCGLGVDIVAAKDID